MELPKHVFSKFRSKDKESFSLIYDRYSGPLYGVILNICKDSNKAQDVLQEVFLTAWNKSDQWNPDKAELFTWLYAIARNKSIDAYRKIEKQRTQDIQEAEGINSTLSTESLTNKNELTSNLANLEYKYRAVIEGLFIKGLSQRELSKETGIPLGTIKTRLKIGLRELRKMYTDPVLVIMIITLILRSNG